MAQKTVQVPENDLILFKWGRWMSPPPPQKKIVGLKAKKNVKNEDRPKIATS